MSKLIIPEGYTRKLNNYDLQKAIGLIHIVFERNLSNALDISRVSAPLLLKKDTGLNDDLNGFEKKVEFVIKDSGDECEVVQSLAKWKRMALKNYDFYENHGLYTDMNAIRKDEELDNTHSVYVDQWDWEKVININDRNINYLKETVSKIINAIIDTQIEINTKFPILNNINTISKEISFITTQELEDMYPGKETKEKENLFVKDHHTTCLLQIGKILTNGKPHESRAPDYDDWELNCDILFWDEVLQCALEISSMGIRVSPESLEKQLKISNKEERINLPFHQALLRNELPYTIGGGIGQSRLCMLLLGACHIGEVQASIWPDEIKEECFKKGILIL